MNESERKRLVWTFLLEESSLDKIVKLVMKWSIQTSPFVTYRFLRLKTLCRIINDRRVGISNFISYYIPRYGGLQFQEHFRMSPMTFQVKTNNLLEGTEAKP